MTHLTDVVLDKLCRQKLEAIFEKIRQRSVLSKSLGLFYFNKVHKCGLCRSLRWTRNRQLTVCSRSVVF